LCIMSFLLYLDRICISQAARRIEEDLDIFTVRDYFPEAPVGAARGGGPGRGRGGGNFPVRVYQW
jgi:hypothetical protein